MAETNDTSTAILVKLHWDAFTNADPTQWVAELHADQSAVTIEVAINSVHAAELCIESLDMARVVPLQLLAEEIFEATNLQQGPLWDQIWPAMSLATDRSHTSMSVGDWIEVDGDKVICDKFGWTTSTVNRDDVDGVVR